MNLAKIVEYFDARILASDSGCWIWAGSRTKAGYGTCSIGGIKTTAHRAQYYIFHGSIPARHEIDHLCGNTLCVNPFHLEAVTHAENVRRGKKANQTHCVHGHIFDVKNTYRKVSSGTRVCRTCAAFRQRQRRLAK